MNLFREWLLCLVLAVFSIPSTANAEVSGFSVNGELIVAEKSRFDLGGPEGQYTAWERSDLRDFVGFETTVKITKFFGKPGDKWSSIARVNLLSGGNVEQKKMLSIVITVDRKSKTISPHVWRKGSEEIEFFDFKSVKYDQPIHLKVIRKNSSTLVVSLNENTYEIECDFEVEGLGALGSGVDVAFDPFNILKREQ
jgi:hypothetical protein